MIGSFEQLIANAGRLDGTSVIVAHPVNDATFSAIGEAQEKLGVRAILAGDRALIERGIQQHGCDPASIEILHTPDIRESLTACIKRSREGRNRILMKGGVDTAMLMKAVLDESSGLRTGRLLSDVFLFEYPRREGNRFVMITDGGITPAPDLRNKVDLIDNAVAVAHALGNEMPRVAVLSATEHVTSRIPSTLDAAALTEMNKRGEIRGCIVDGPLALDVAVSEESAAEKGIDSRVAGRADILIAPNIETANCLAKSTTYFAGYRLAHVIVGSSLPILIPSRADKSDARFLSIALGMIVSGRSA
jgi:phosphate butyryltransferase